MEDMEGVEGNAAESSASKNLDTAEMIWQIDHSTGVPKLVNRNGRELTYDEEPDIGPTHWDTSQLTKFLEASATFLISDLWYQ